ncbi:MAG: sugar transferase [Thermoanaerobaculia bacterium]
MLKQRAKLIARFFYVLDVALIALAFFAAFFIRDFVLPALAPAHFPSGLYPLSEYVKIFPFVVILWSLLLFSNHSYHSHRTVALRKEALDTLHVVVIGTAVLASVAYLVPLSQLSRVWFVLFAALSAVLLLLNRITVRLVARYVRAHGLNYRTILIVGSGKQAREAAELIESHRYWGYKILGYISDGHHVSHSSKYQVVGTLNDLRKIVEHGLEGREKVDEIVFALNRRKLETCQPVFDLCEELGIRARIAMNFVATRAARVEVEELEGVPFMTLTTTPNEAQLALKRVFDVAISAFLLLLSFPVVLLTAIAIRLTSSGSVLFKQERLGLNGRVFTLYKFRTMIADAHQRRSEVEHLNEMNGPVFKAKSDPRVTFVGRILRKFSLDELPQLWNVLKGDMSLVGPRPPIPEEVSMYERWQRRRLSMKPGLTCLWQVSGRNDIDFDRWMKLDLQYIDEWSPTLDLKILLRTIPAVISGRGAS